MPAFAANLSFLWTELPLLERIDAAADAGFPAIEIGLPYEAPADEIRARLDAGAIKQALFNLPAGDWAAGERGTASNPDRVEEFRAGVAQALEYAQTLDCPQCNCLSGLELEGVERDVQWRTLVENVRWAAGQFAGAGRRLLIEPINTYDMPGFLVPTPGDALRLIDEAGDDRVLLQFDAYHTQRMEGDAAGRLLAVKDRVGHIQIADAPGRHQPGTGELDFAALFAAIEQIGYTGFVGLEYIPTDGTNASLEWLGEFGFSLPARS